MGTSPLFALAESRRAGRASGIVSVCSAHPLVIEAALLQAQAGGGPALIEATCNQVNQEGGYTGMRPADFRDLVFSIADRVGLARDRIMLGGDHLGPNPWRALPAAEAMRHAEIMVADYVQAGFEKIHLDASMACADDGVAPADSEIATRSARLCAAAEGAAKASGSSPCYVIGTEVPTPGGAVGALHALEVTAPEAAERTLVLHEAAFAAHGVEAALTRVIALVVQPGVEFGDDSVAFYDPAKAVALSAVLERHPGLMFEAHSTDYQHEEGLERLVQDGFGILKVGPWLTFALREALYALDAALGAPFGPRAGLAQAMERAMLAAPKYWEPYAVGTPEAQQANRHFGYSDRIRYYWGGGEAQAMVETLLGGAPLGETLVSQYFPRLYERVRAGTVPATPRALVIEAIRDVCRVYAAAATERPRR